LARRRRIGLGVGLLLGCAALIVWIVGLSLSLPAYHETGGWRLAWTGYDVVELIALGVTAYGALRDRWLLVPASVVTATLLLCDAWFDVTLAAGTSEFVISLLTALLVEIPTAALLGLVAWQLTRLSAGYRIGDADKTSSTHAVPILAVAVRRTGASEADDRRETFGDDVCRDGACGDGVLGDGVLEDDVRAILDGPSVATLATVGPDGEPRSRAVQVRRDGDALLLFVATHQPPRRQLVAEVPVSVAVHDLTAPGAVVEIRGTARLIPGREPTSVAAVSADIKESAPQTPSMPAIMPVQAPQMAPVDAGGIRLVARLVPTAITRLAC